MYIDNQLQLSSAQAVTVTAASTSYVDLGAARDIGVGKQLYVLITVGTTVTAAGAATVQFQLQFDSSSGFGSAVTAIQTDVIPKATLVANYQFVMAIPPGQLKQYMRLNYVVATGPLTAGTFTAQVIDAPQLWTAYPDLLSKIV